MSRDIKQLALVAIVSICLLVALAFYVLSLLPWQPIVAGPTTQSATMTIVANPIDFTTPTGREAGSKSPLIVRVKGTTRDGDGDLIVKGVPPAAGGNDGTFQTDVLMPGPGTSKVMEAGPSVVGTSLIAALIRGLSGSAHTTTVEASSPACTAGDDPVNYVIIELPRPVINVETPEAAAGQQTFIIHFAHQDKLNVHVKILASGEEFDMIADGFYIIEQGRKRGPFPLSGFGAASKAAYAEATKLKNLADLAKIPMTWSP